LLARLFAGLGFGVVVLDKGVEVIDTIKQFFQEDNNRMSLMRLQCFIMCITGIVRLFMGATFAELSLVFGIAFGSKITQKLIETKTATITEGKTQ
jgi:hypothetical protein